MTTALLVVDAQRIYTDAESEYYCEDFTATIDNINSIIARFEESGEPVVLIRHSHKVDGSDVGRLFDFSGEPAEDFDFKEGSNEVTYDVNLNRPDDAIEITKNRYSAFENTDLVKRLRDLRVDKVVVVGFMTNFCCESTARSALDRDFYVDFILDATGTPGTDNMDQEEVRKVVAELLGAGFARVLSTEEFLGQ